MKGRNQGFLLEVGIVFAYASDAVIIVVSWLKRKLISILYFNFDFHAFKSWMRCETSYANVFDGIAIIVPFNIFPDIFRRSFSLSLLLLQSFQFYRFSFSLHQLVIEVLIACSKFNLVGLLGLKNKICPLSFLSTLLCRLFLAVKVGA